MFVQRSVASPAAAIDYAYAGKLGDVSVVCPIRRNTTRCNRKAYSIAVGRDVGMASATTTTKVVLCHIKSYHKSKYKAPGIG